MILQYQNWRTKLQKKLTKMINLHKNQNRKENKINRRQTLKIKFPSNYRHKFQTYHLNLFKAKTVNPILLKKYQN